MIDWTTLLEWVGMRWRRSAPLAQRAPRIFPMEHSTPHVPGEYRALHAYLEHRYASVVVLERETRPAVPRPAVFPIAATAVVNLDG